MNWKILYIGYVLTVGICANGLAQLLNDASRQEIMLSDDVKVIVFASADDERRYYYVPQTIQLSVDKGLPEISLILYTQKGSNAIDGGILHVLIKWGLSPEQEKKTQELLRRKVDSLAVLVGAAEITLPDEHSFQIVPGHPISDILLRSSTAPIKMPALALHKTAISFRLSAKDASSLREAVQNPDKSRSAKFQCRFSYQVARRQGVVRIASESEAMMRGSVSSWMKSIRQYNLMKFVNI